MLAVCLLIVLFATPALPVGAADSDDPSEDLVAQPLVFNGVDTENPGWVVSILDGGSYICSGSLVHPQWVLTAAHCVDDGISGLTVNAGADRWFQGQQRDMSSAHIHPGYTGEFTSVDLAMVRLESAVNGTALPRLASSSAWPVFHQPLVVAGWGLTSDGSGIPDILQSAEVFVYSDATVGADEPRCPENAVAPSGYDDFCYGGVSWGCSGDSGGPLVGYPSPQHTSGSVETIYGVTSFGDAFSCSSANIDTIAQGVGRHYSWIRSFFSGAPGVGDEMFFYREDGLYRYYDVRNDGTLSLPIRAGDDYTTGWSTITGIDLEGDGQDEMFFYRDDGLFRYYNVKPDGSLPQPILAGSGYTTGWDSIAAIDLDGDGQDEMFFYRDDGLFRFYNIKPNGSIGTPILAGEGYTTGWDAITAVDLDGDGQDEIFFYRSDGLFRYYDIDSGGEIGRPLLAGSGYTTGWDAITAVDLHGDGEDEMFFYRGDGLYRFYPTQSNGALGSPISAGSNFTSGWSSIASLNLDGS